jgi:hypothetical protein
MGPKMNQGLSNKLLIEGVITIQDIWGMSENENI